MPKLTKKPVVIQVLEAFEGVTSETATVAAAPGPGCERCDWTGLVDVQAPHKPTGVAMCSAPCPQCAPSPGTD